ncbi:MAG: YbhB/YbcL family Raf kinase inhibitor-like protein [Chloroflexi bacterium]|nr:YbhB/YbcL family Raf kinase inhibitor-like protein [Chloroflexota bacterium]
MTFTLTSSSFADGAAIPQQFTCDGADRSPQLSWSGVPGAASFVLIMDDPDAPGGTFTHWVLYDIPGTRTELVEGETGVGLAGGNDFRRRGYGGPCPPRGRGAHRYFFRLAALDVASLGLPASAARRDVEAAMRGHVVATATLMGRYERR